MQMQPYHSLKPPDYAVAIPSGPAHVLPLSASPPDAAVTSSAPAQGIIPLTSGPIQVGSHTSSSPPRARRSRGARLRPPCRLNTRARGAIYGVASRTRAPDFFDLLVVGGGASCGRALLLLDLGGEGGGGAAHFVELEHDEGVAGRGGSAGRGLRARRVGGAAGPR